MSTAIRVARWRHSISVRAYIAAVTASGPSPPPDAYKVLRLALISDTSGVKPTARGGVHCCCQPPV